MLTATLSTLSFENLDNALKNAICDVYYISLLCEDCKQPQKHNGKPGLFLCHCLISYYCRSELNYAVNNCSYKVNNPKKWVGPLIPLAMTGVQMLKSNSSFFSVINTSYFFLQYLIFVKGGISLDYQIDLIDSYLNKIGHNTECGYKEMEKSVLGMYAKTSLVSSSTVYIIFNLVLQSIKC